MRILLSACLALAPALPAAGQPRYDRKLEDAVKAIVAARIGELRGGFDLDDRPVIVMKRETGVRGMAEFTSAYEVRWAAERRAGVSSF